MKRAEERHSRNVKLVTFGLLLLAVLVEIPAWMSYEVNSFCLGKHKLLDIK